MLKKVFGVIKKLASSVLIIYGLNLVIDSIGIIIPINIITVLSISILGLPGLLSLLFVFVVFY